MIALGPSDKAGVIIHTGSEKRLSFDAFMEEISSSRAVIVGEVHDKAEDHLVQLQILLGLAMGRRPVYVGIEYLPWTMQAKLDDYISGAASEEEFLRLTDWNGNWGYPFHLVRPVFLAARKWSVGIACLNAPKEIVMKVAREGIKGLNESERALIAAEIDLENVEHRRYVRAVFDRHPHFSPGKYDYFYEAQCVWEDTMAEKAASYLRGRDGVMVILCGRGHIVEGFGIPNRLRKRTEGKIVTVVPLTQHRPFSRNIADYVWITGGGPTRDMMEGRPESP
jgi:uncharacterized iron-regulated protein